MGESGLLSIIFIVMFFYAGFTRATQAIMAVALFQCLWQYALHRRLTFKRCYASLLVLLFGGSTLYFHTPLFLQMKSTLVSWGLAFWFAWMQNWRGISIPGEGMQYLLSYLEGHPVEVSKAHQRYFTWCWVAFFTCLGAANLIIILYASLRTWVYFKLAAGLLSSGLLLWQWSSRRYVLASASH